MRVLTLALAVALVAPAGATAAVPSKLPTDTDLQCWQTRSRNTPGIPSWDTVQRGVLRFNTQEQDGVTPAGYDYDAAFLPPVHSTSGDWSASDRAITFTGGPLADSADGYAISGLVTLAAQAMPHDGVKYRAFPLVLRSVTDEKADDAPAFDEQTDPDVNSYWYCGLPGVAPLTLFANDVGWVSKRTGIDVRLPSWVQTNGVPADAVGRVRVAKKGYYRLMVCLDDKPAKTCQSDAIFSAKRAAASQLGHRTRLKLAKGVTGWGGSYGCAFNGDDPDWGPLYCGRTAVVFHFKAVNWAVESPTASLKQEVRWANQLIRG